MDENNTPRNASLLSLLGSAVRRLFGARRSAPESAAPPSEFPAKYEKFLLRNVPHYRCLDEGGRALFRRRAAAFLDTVVFHGAGVKVTPALRLLAASAAVVPTLGFPDWEWPRLREIIFRPDGYEHGSHEDDDGVVTEYAESGMVGVSGILSGVMMLSSEDLTREFAHPEEGGNVGFHEFAHLMADGGLLLAERDRAGWPGLVRAEQARIRRGDSLLDDYALLNGDEFFAVASELFFTVPRLLHRRHRRLYAVLSRCYRQNPARRLRQ